LAKDLKFLMIKPICSKGFNSIPFEVGHAAFTSVKIRWKMDEKRKQKNLVKRKLQIKFFERQ
jgi:hypothetical protein